MNKKLYRTLGIGLLGSTLLLGLAACNESGSYIENQPKNGAETGEETGPLKVGSLLPLTGDGASYGIPMQRVLQYTVAKVNEQGGIKGRTLELIYEDSKCDGKSGATAAQKLINVDKVKIILGGFCSSETLGAAPIAEAAGVVLFSGGSSSPDITTAGDYIFRNYPSDASQGKVMGNIAVSMKLKKIGMLTEENDYTIGIDKVFTETVKAGGVEVVNETFLPTDTDFRTQITKLKGAGIDAVFINPQTPPKADLLMKQLQEQGVAGIKLFANDVVMGYTEGMTRYATLVEGMVGAETSYEATHPDFVAMAAEYTEKYSEELPYPNYAATVYDSVMILKEGVEAVGHDADAFKTYLYGISGRKGLAGSLTMNSSGEPEGGHQPKMIKGGAKVPYVASMAVEAEAAAEV